MQKAFASGVPVARKLSAFFVVVVLLMATRTVAAQSLSSEYNTPVYDAAAKRYFALINARAPAGTPYPRAEGLTWDEAARAAESQGYKGVRGRLAVVDSVEVHYFLLKHFPIDVETWIGLRYWCGSQKLEWSNGTFLKPGSFVAWDRQWKQDVFACRSAPRGNEPEFMPVAYSRSYTWIGKGWEKRFLQYFVEFPTGKP